jgi:hypothetical protein
MSFALTTEQILNGTKDVTRRLGWKFLKAGDKLMACEKCQGIKKGGLVRLGVIEVVSVSREKLSRLRDQRPGEPRPYPLKGHGLMEVKREGFPKMTVSEFLAMFCEHMKCDEGTEVTRIEFKILETYPQKEKRNQDGSSGTRQSRPIPARPVKGEESAGSDKAPSPSGEGATFQVFDMDEVVWVVARSLAEAKRFYLSEFENDDLSGARALTDEEMQKFNYWDTEDRDPMAHHHWKCECGEMADSMCRWNGFAYEHHHGYPIGHVMMENIHCRSFAKHLEARIANGLDGPDWFATSEF